MRRRMDGKGRVGYRLWAAGRDPVTSVAEDELLRPSGGSGHDPLPPAAIVHSLRPARPHSTPTSPTPCTPFGIHPHATSQLIPDVPNGGSTVSGLSITSQAVDAAATAQTTTAVRSVFGNAEDVVIRSAAPLAPSGLHQHTAPGSCHRARYSSSSLLHTAPI
jgi:hypothetical protein